MVAETTTSMNIHSHTPCLHQCLPACPPALYTRAVGPRVHCHY
jgi:hypothetical protein